MKRFLTLALAFAMLLTICACTKRPEEAAEEPTDEGPVEIDDLPTRTPVPETPTPSEEPKVVLYRNQFNGEPLDEPDNARPFAVMINNHQSAQPQCATSEADIIFEVLAEGGITRMMAIYSDIKTESPIGAIRSIRTYYVSIAMSFDAVTCHAGWSPSAQTMIRNNGINNIDGVSGSYSVPVFYRDKARQSSGYAYEHTLFAKGVDLYAGAESKGYPLETDEDYSSGLVFSDDVLIEGDDAEKFTVTFNSGKSTSFTYHEDEAMYTAFQHKKDYYDGNTNENCEFENVIVFSAVTSVVDGEGRIDVKLVSEGDGYFFHNGKVTEIKWSRAGENEPFIYTYENGDPVELGVGKTYICIIPTSDGSVSYE